MRLVFFFCNCFHESRPNEQIPNSVLQPTPNGAVEVVRWSLLCWSYRSQLSELTGIPQATISAIENGRVNLGVERAKVLARALKCHPAVLVFPGWDVPLESAA